ncbi:hypothetical protein BDW71DRAFT_85832 [Aspergillus fruticulosus]
MGSLLHDIAIVKWSQALRAATNPVMQIQTLGFQESRHRDWLLSQFLATSAVILTLLSINFFHTLRTLQFQRHSFGVYSAS